jgi:hypothetical protein
MRTRRKFYSSDSARAIILDSRRGGSGPGIFQSFSRQIAKPGKWDHNQTMLSRCCALMAFLLAFAGPARAQQNECRHRIVPVHIATRDGAAPPRFSTAQFQAAFADKTIGVTAISDEQKPQHLVLLLDASGSVRGGTTAGWQATVEVASQLLASLPPLEVGLALFAEEVEPVVVPTSARDRVMEEVERLRSGPPEAQDRRRQRTALWDSLLGTAKRFGPLQPGDVLYVITDGVDNFSQARPGAVTQALFDGGIRLFAFAIANRGFAYGSGELERMVEDTGGVLAAGSATDWRFFRAARGSSPIGDALYEQHRQMLGFRRLELELPEPIVRPQPWHLALTGLDEEEMKNVVLSYPARLFPCE